MLVLPHAEGGHPFLVHTRAAALVNALSRRTGRRGEVSR
jgi:hypothetical protein